MSEALECTIENEKLVVPCRQLLEACEFGNPRGKRKGIYCWEYFKFDAEGPQRRFYGVKSGDFVQQGVVFNFCPFCGKRIDIPVNKEQEAGDAK